jgi:tRNA pseudouridine13 synthase
MDSRKRARPEGWKDSADDGGSTAASDGAVAAPAAAVAADGVDTSESPAAAAWLTEEDVGIRLFLTDGPGFRGVIKQRFTDFIVRELAKDTGAPVRLTSLEVPVESGPETETDAAGQPVPLAVTGLNKLAALVGEAAAGQLAALLRAAGVDVPARAGDAATQGDVAAADSSSAEVHLREVRFPAPADKDARKAVHTLVRQYFGGVCDTGTEGGAPGGPAAAGGAATSQQAPPPPSQVIRVFRKSGGAGGKGAGAGTGAGASGNRDVFRGSRSWPGGKPNFVRFVLHKRNYDTPSALHALCRAAGLRDGLFGYAGIKDRRGVTSQHVTAFQVAPERLARANASLGGDILVGDYAYVPKKLRLGDLAGNRFGLVLRNVGVAATVAGDGTGDGDAAVAAAAAATGAMTRWGAAGYRFVNYFGLQRFGTGEAPTHEVGRAMLQRRWDAAVDLLLSPPTAIASTGGASQPSSSRMKPDEAAARQAWATSRDAAAALAVVPRYLHVETALLRGLVDAGGASAPGACEAACAALPHRTRSLYLHAYQSALWNDMATRRLSASGGGAAGPVEGDLVYATAGVEDADGDEPPPPGEGGDGGADDGAAGGGGKGGASKEGGSKGLPYGQLPEVRVLTAADAASGAYALTDVLLPLPGYAVRYPGPGHACSAVAVAARLQADGFALGLPPAGAGASGSAPRPADGPQHEAVAVAVAVMRSVWHPRVRDYQLCGGYRRVVEAARDVQWDVVAYDDPSAPLATTDRDQLPPGQWPLPAKGAAAASSSSSSTAAPAPSLAATTASGSSSSGAYTGLRLSLSLPKSAYATMALREVMKVSTAKLEQAALNAAPAGALAAAAAGATS